MFGKDLRECWRYRKDETSKNVTSVTGLILTLLLDCTRVILEEFLQLISFLLQSFDFLLKSLICFQVVIIFYPNVLDLFSTLHSTLLCCQLVLLSFLKYLVSLVRTKHVKLWREKEIALTAVPPQTQLKLSLYTNAIHLNHFSTTGYMP